MSNLDKIYGEEHIKTLEGRVQVRKRPSMYIGSVEKPNHLALEIIANSLDEAMNGFGERIVVRLEQDGETLSVRDYGRGIVVDGKRKEDDKSTLEAAFSVLNTGGKYDQAAFSNSLGANGIGSKATTFLSETLTVSTYRDGKHETLVFKQGELEKRSLGDTAEENGLFVQFKPDKEIFDSTKFDVDLIHKTLRDMAYLTRGVEFVFVDVVNGETTPYLSENGLKDYLDDIVEDNSMIKTPLYIDATDGDKMFLEVALTYQYGSDTFVKTYANNGHTPDNGTHLSSFKRILTRQLNLFAQEHDLYREGEKNLTGRDYDNGLVLLLNIKAPDLAYDSQTKTRVTSTDLGSFIGAASNDAVKLWLDSNPADATKVINTALEARRAENAAQKAKDKIRKAPINRSRSGLKAKAELSDKLIPASTSTKVKDRELFILEGKSAEGSATSARDPKTQALYSIRGKSLNAERASVERALENQEYIDMINIIGAGFGDDFEVSRSQYGKIIILTDADDDGFHIQILLLTFLFNYMRGLIEEGMVYIAQPPLYIASKGDEKIYLKNDEELKEFEKTHTGYFIDRFKGLGSMSYTDLSRTTMDKETRNLVQVSIDDFKGATKIIGDLMGEDVETRRQYIFKHASEIVI